MYSQDPVLTTRLVSLPLRRRPGTHRAGARRAAIDLRVAGEVNRSILPDAMDAAIAYGEKTNSHALLIFHDGALQLEHYYPGFDASSCRPRSRCTSRCWPCWWALPFATDTSVRWTTRSVSICRSGPADGRGRITLRQMLQQSSGIDYPTIGWNPLGGFTQLVLGDDIAPIVLGEPLEAEPGEPLRLQRRESAGPRHRDRAHHGQALRRLPGVSLSGATPARMMPK